MRFTQRFVFIVFLVSGSVSQAEVYDVSTTAELREALDAIGQSGGENTVRIAPGTYSNGGRAIWYKAGPLSNAKKLTLKAADPNEKPIFDNFALQNEGLNDRLVFDGLHFQNGSGFTQILYFANRTEHCEIRDSVFIDHVVDAGVVGGCVNLHVENSIFRGNSGPGASLGVGWYAQGNSFEIISTEFSDNQMRALYINRWTQGQVSDSVFSNNHTVGQGGAIYNEGDGVVISASVFSNNHAVGQGGAIYSEGGDLVIDGNIFDGNSTAGGSVSGGKLYSNIFRNHERQSSEEGVRSAILVDVGALSNNIFEQNNQLPALTGRSGLINNNLFSRTTLSVADSSTVTNNIFINNEEDVITDESADITAFFNNNYLDESRVADAITVEGDSNFFEGVHLGFVNAEEGDYRLASSSDLIDAGSTDPDLAYITDYDYTGTTARVIGASIDIGPYEYDGEAPTDSDGDGINDNIDNCPSIANEDQADFDSDGEGDACDSDDDNDGTNDEDDAFPFDDTESLDTDSDGIGNNEDEDDDGDGTLDDSDPQPIIANVFAIDSDGDGVADSIDDYPTDATKQFSSDGDFDGDGFTNDEEVDYCTNPFDKNSQPDVGGLSAWMLYLGTQEQDAQ